MPTRPASSPCWRRWTRTSTAPRTCCARALKIEPADLDAASRLIDLLGSQKAWREAEAGGAADRRRCPTTRASASSSSRACALAQKKNAEAVDAFRKALEKNPGWVARPGGPGRHAERDGPQRTRPTKVLQDFRKKYPDNLSAKYLEGSALARSGDTAARREDLQRDREARSPTPASPGRRWPA